MLRAKLNEAEQIGMVDEFLHYTIHTIARTAWKKEGDKGPGGVSAFNGEGALEHIACHLKADTVVTQAGPNPRRQHRVISRQTM